MPEMGKTSGRVAPITTGMRGGGYRPYSPVQGIGTGQGGMADILMQMVAQEFLKSRDMFGGGLGGGNLYNRMQSQRLQASHDEMLKEAAKQDVDTAYRLQLGFKKASGYVTADGPTPKQREEILADAAKIAAYGPTAVQVLGPGFVDKLGGSRGMNVSMAEHMFQGGQFKMDPTTGRLTMGTQSSIDLNKEVYKNLFEGQSGASRTHGMSAGDVGSMFNEMQRAGLMRGGRITPEDLLNDSGKFSANHDKALARALLAIDKNLDVGSGEGRGFGESVDSVKIRARVAELNPADRQKLAESSDVSSSLKTFDVTRTTRTLESYTQALGAMREIFGDAGHPNAPMATLIDSLNQLSGGALTQISPGKLSTMVRETWNLAQNAGIGLEGLTIFSEVATQQVREAGVSDIHSMPVVQTGLAFRNAYAKADHVPQWGLSNINVLQMKAQQRHIAAIKSPAYNIAGAATRIQDTAGGFVEGSQAEAYADAVRRGQSEFTYGKVTRSIGDVDATEFATMVSGGSRAGFDEADAWKMLEQTKANEPFAYKYDAGASLIQAQAAELLRDVNLPTMLRGSGEKSATKLGFSDNDAVDIGTFVGRAASKTFQNMTAADSTEVTAPAAFAAGLMKELEAVVNGDKDAIPGLSKVVARNYLNKLRKNPHLAKGIGALIHGEASEYFESGLAVTGKNTFADTRALYDQDTRAGVKAERVKAKVQRIVQTALGGVGYSAVRRGFDAVMNYDGTREDADVFAEALGGVRKKDIADLLQKKKVFERLRNEKKRLEDAITAHSADPGDPEKGKELDSARAEVDAIMKEVGVLLGKGGYGGPRNEKEVAEEKQRQTDAITETDARSADNAKRKAADEDVLTDDQWRDFYKRKKTKKKEKRSEEEDDEDETTAGKGSVEIKIAIAAFTADFEGGGANMSGVGTVTGVGLA